jgi:hypothetical protein
MFPDLLYSRDEIGNLGTLFYTTLIYKTFHRIDPWSKPASKLIWGFLKRSAEGNSGDTAELAYASAACLRDPGSNLSLERILSYSAWVRNKLISLVC